ncbi:MAG: ectoine hydroxylase [Acidimicrobiia bacterium]
MTTMTDRYPSRVGGDLSITERPDPVVWGDGQRRGPLDEGQLKNFDHDGFLVLENVLDLDTVQRALDEIEHLRGDRETLASHRAVLEPDSDELRSLFEVHKTSTVFSELARDPRLVDAARQIVDDDVYIHQSRINLKPAIHGKSFQWHSDFETWHVEDGIPSMRTVSASIALTDNHSWNGPLYVIAGSHRYYVAFPGVTPQDNHLTSLKSQEHGSPDQKTLEWLLDRGEIATFEAPAGSVLFFDCNIMHGSPNNISPLPRTNGFLVYNSVENAAVEPFGTDEARPEHIATREPDVI